MGRRSPTSTGKLPTAPLLLGSPELRALALASPVLARSLARLPRAEPEWHGDAPRGGLDPSAIRCSALPATRTTTSGGKWNPGAPGRRRRRRVLALRADGARKRLRLPLVEFPGPVASRALLSAVPWRVASGGAGFIPHLSLAVLFAPIALGVGLQASHISIDAFSLGTAVVGAVVCSMLGGWRKRTFRSVALLALVVGVLLGLVPMLTRAAFDASISLAALNPSPRAAALVVYGLAIFVGASIFGAYLAALARFGLNNEQAFAALGHPGYKHFIRMRVRADGSAIDAWVIGLVDPLGDPTPVLVDRVTFRPTAVRERLSYV